MPLTVRAAGKTGALALLFGLAAAAPAQAPRAVRFHGAVVAQDVRLIGGRPFVPLSDLARALGGVAVKSGGGYDIQAAGGEAVSPDAPGGTDQVKGRQGRIGDTLFDGRWRFQVLEVRRADDYTERFDPDAESLQPKGAGDTLVIVTCRVRNGLKSNQSLGFFPQYAHTALADEDGGSYPPLAADIRPAAHLKGLATEELLPGAKADFALVFSVPRAAQLKDLVFTLTNQVGEPKSDVRVSLAP